jgi:uncharacterized protein (DUF1697 family)
MAGSQIALLRGINVGRAKRVSMAELRALVEGLGYCDVRTLLNSGNIVYNAGRVAPGKAAARIELALVAELAVSARVTVLTAQELSEVIAENPLLDVADNHSHLLVAVLSDPADRTKLTPLLKHDWAREALAVGKRVAYIWSPDGVLASQAAEAVNRTLGDAVTTRNWATVMKLHALAQG